MKFKSSIIFSIFLIAGILLVAGCGSKKEISVQGTEKTTSGSQQTVQTQDTAVQGAPDTASVDTLNKDLDTTDLDNIAVTVDANTFK